MQKWRARLLAGPVDHPDLQQESVFREELVLVTPLNSRY